jgi:glycosyltransferase involved in cell wall biosynthesis
MPNNTSDAARNIPVDIFCLDTAYSTTRRVTTQRPVLDNHPNDAFDSSLFLPAGEGRQGEGGLRTKGYFKKNQDDKPLLSIITVVLNNNQFIEKTIHSIHKQSYDNIELIIIDGGSTDGTVNAIKKYNDTIDYWISENDHGISEAFNKGIKLASGSYIYILNSGDVLFSEHSISKAIKKIDNDHFIYSYQVARHNKKPFPLYKYSITRPDNKNLRTAITCAMSAHQGTLVASCVYKKIGLYDTSLKIRMDFDFFLRAQKEYSFRCRNEPLSFFDTNGISGKTRNIYRFKKEEYSVINSYQKNIWANIYFFCHLPYYIMKRFFSKSYYSVKK